MLVIPISSKLYQLLKEFAKTRRMVFMAGLPGTGKSLLIQQLALIANEMGRQVHLLQYDVARRAFETEENIAKYPEIDGVTDPAIRKGVGLWSRDAVQQWHEAHPEPEHMLIGELPLIGNRLIELVEVHHDTVEALLSSQQALFVIVVPSWEVRTVIEERRAKTIANPQHEKEKLDAPPNVLRALWVELNALAHQIDLTKAHAQTPYNPYIYGGVYEALLQHRHAQFLLIEHALTPKQSVYELGVAVNELLPTAAEANHIMQQIERIYTPAEVEQMVANWHAIITNDPKIPDPGPELRLPMPEELPGITAKTALTDTQRAALQSIMALPLNARPEEVIPAIDKAFDVLTRNTTVITANVKKFDLYDSYFNVTRTNDNEDGGIVFLAGLLQAYRNVMHDLQTPPHTLTVVEMPLLRIALETTLSQFIKARG